MPKLTRCTVLLLSLVALLAAGPALAKKPNVNLDGSSGNLDGKYKLDFEDGGSKFGCGPSTDNTNVSANFNGGRVTGTLAGTFFEGKVKQSGKRGRKLKVKLTKASKQALKVGIANLVDGCIVNLGSKVTKLKQLDVKGTINKKFNKLKIVVDVEFEGKGDGLFRNLKGDDVVYLLKVSGPLISELPPAR